MATASGKGSSSTGKAPSVEYRHNVARGKHEIGVVIEGSFVTFADLDEPVVAQRVEREAAITEAASEASEEEGE